MAKQKKSIFKKIGCAIRKWMSARIIPHMVFNGWRVFFYKLCGYKIGKHVFIGMRCYLDDLEPKMLTIEDNVTVSYGVFMACHGKNQPHLPITIKKGAFIGMRSTIISKNSLSADASKGVTIGENAIVGACTLVNRDVPDNATAVGVPCRVIKQNDYPKE